MMLWSLMTLTLVHCAVVKINKDDKTHQVVFKRIGNYATDVHFHNIRIPVNLSTVIETPMKAMRQVKAFVNNVYQISLVYYREDHHPNTVDKHQAHVAAQLVKESSDFVMNTSYDQLTEIKNNLISIISTLPESNTRPELQVELLFGLGATLFSLYNYINQKADNNQISRNKQSITDFVRM